MDAARTSRELSHKLQLRRKPIGVAFVDSRPDTIAQTDAAVPSACTFWAMADAGVLYADAAQHFNCPVGAMTMGFDMPSDVKGDLMDAVQQMCEREYISGDEPSSIPSVSKPKSGIVYGPLEQLPVQPDVVLIWLDPSQAMVFNEAAGSATWADSMTPALYGRPTCAALPVALNEQRPTMSLGCIGMRTFTGTPADLMLAVVPADIVEPFLAALHTAAQANVLMQQSYETQKARFA